MLTIFAVEIGANRADELGFAQEVLRFDHGPLGVNPVRCAALQPGTLDRQLTDHDPHATCPLGLPVMSPTPAADFLAQRPAGIIPQQQEGCLGRGRQALTHPVEKGGCTWLTGRPSTKRTSISCVSA